MNHWENYRTTGLIETDEALLSMMKDLCEAIRLLTMIDEHKYMMEINYLLSTWDKFRSFAFHRNITDYPQI